MISFQVKVRAKVNIVAGASGTERKSNSANMGSTKRYPHVKESQGVLREAYESR